MKRSLAIVAVAGALTVAHGCGKPAPPPGAGGPGDPHARAGGQKLEPADLAGAYAGAGIRLVLRAKNERYVIGVYDRGSGGDDGTLVTEMNEDRVLRGWWTEAPTRKADADAGEVEFACKRAGEGIHCDGRLRAGVSGPWQEDFDVDRTGDAAPADLAARFAAEDTFVGHPD
jgi:hypothetical protein